MRTDWVARDELRHILAALMPGNRLAMEIALDTGLRIGDVLALRTDQLGETPPGRGRRLTVKELKTGKSRRIWLSAELLDRCRRMAGRYWVFEGRTSVHKHRTRQAVYKDVKRVSRLFKVPLQLQGRNIATHTARKAYAVAEYARTGDLAAVQRRLNHDDPATTLIYALADHLVARRRGDAP